MGSEAWGGSGGGLQLLAQRRESAELLSSSDPKSLVYNSKEKTMQNFRMEAVSQKLGLLVIPKCICETGQTDRKTGCDCRQMQL